MACLGYVMNAMKIVQRYTQGQGVSVVIGTSQGSTEEVSQTAASKNKDIIYIIIIEKKDSK